MTSRSRVLVLLLPCLLGAGCASSSQCDLVLRRGTTVELLVLGDNPFVQVDNDGPGSIEVSFEVVGTLDRVRILRGSSARTLRGGGRLDFVLVEGEVANVQVQVQGAVGLDMRTQGKQQ